MWSVNLPISKPKSREIDPGTCCNNRSTRTVLIENFNLIVLDIKMPGMDGIEALGRIIGTQRSLPVVIHSAFSHYKDNYLTWSAEAYVVKSGDLTELKTKVSELINKNKNC